VALTTLVSKRTPIRVYVISRDKASRQSWLKNLQHSIPKAEINWLKGRVTLLAEVKRLYIEIRSWENGVDLLFLSAGFLPFAGRHRISPHLLSDFNVNQASNLAHSPTCRNFRRPRNFFSPPLLEPHPLHCPLAPPPNCSLHASTLKSARDQHLRCRL
jgi:hypothetical protein